MLFLSFFSIFIFQSRLSVYLTHSPAGTSVQDILHWKQVGIPGVQLCLCKISIRKICASHEAPLCKPFLNRKRQSVYKSELFTNLICPSPEVLGSFRSLCVCVLLLSTLGQIVRVLTKQQLGLTFLSFPPSPFCQFFIESQIYFISVLLHTVRF